MEKRGIGHIEVILSFILFIGAIGFAVYYFVPEGARYGSISEERALEVIIQNVSSELISYSVYVNGGVGGMGAKLGISIPSVEVPNNFNAIVTNLSGANKMEIAKTSGGVCVQRNPANWPSRDFLYIKLSEDFISSSNLDCNDYNPVYYQIVSRDSEKIASEKRLLRLNQSYYLNYDKLKENIGIKSNNDFAFSFAFTNGQKIEAQKEIPSGLDVYSVNKKIKIIRNNGIEYGDLTVRIW
jgi:hypothetical protein